MSVAGGGPARADERKRPVRSSSRLGFRAVHRDDYQATVRFSVWEGREHVMVVMDFGPPGGGASITTYADEAELKALITAAQDALAAIHGEPAGGPFVSPPIS